MRHILLPSGTHSVRQGWQIAGLNTILLSPGSNSRYSLDAGQLSFSTIISQQWFQAVSSHWFKLAHNRNKLICHSCFREHLQSVTCNALWQEWIVNSCVCSTMDYYGP